MKCLGERRAAGKMIPKPEPRISPHDPIETARQALRGGQFAQAETILRGFLETSPNNAIALKLLAAVLHSQNRLADTLPVLREYLALRPSDAPMLSTMGVLLAELGRQSEALAMFQRATQADPALAEAHNNSGVALEQLDRLDEAEASCRRAIALKPDYADAHNNLGNVLRKLHRHNQAIEQHRKAIEVNPSHAPSYHNLATTFDELAMPEEAYVWRKKLVDLVPNDAQLHSDLLYSTLCVPDISPKERFAMHVEWGQRHAVPLYKHWKKHTNDRTPDRILRIGYVSPNFGAQAIGWFILPLLQAHDRKQVSVYCYSDIARPDWMTQKIKAAADFWRDTSKLDFWKVAEVIREDKIDILIDLRGHMAGHRLLTFALKPAPIQMSYLGYQYTVGFDAIDYRICDQGTDPVGLTEQFHVEKLLRLNRTIWCYRPPEENPQRISYTPAEKNGYITFGVFQKPAKLNGFIIELWCRILEKVPRSKLMILVPSERTIEQLRSICGRRGIDSERVVPAFQGKREEYLSLYNRCDLALDTFPYAGVTTTCDALWMGCPMLTLLGPEPFQRAGASFLPYCGMDWFLAQQPAEYVQRADAASRTAGILSRMRRELSIRLCGSAALQEDSLAVQVANGFRQAWIAM
jgi:protein O-GlcNAc transferase